MHNSIIAISGGSRISQDGGWGANPWFWSKNLLFGNVFAKNFIKMKEIAPKGSTNGQSVADPGFSLAGGVNPPGGAWITPNFPKNCMKSKEFGRPGGGVRPSRPPLDPPMPVSGKYVLLVWKLCLFIRFCVDVTTNSISCVFR